MANKHAATFAIMIIIVIELYKIFFGEQN